MTADNPKAVDMAQSKAVVNPAHGSRINQASRRRLSTQHMNITAPKAKTAPNADSSGVAIQPLHYAMPPAWLPPDQRFERLGESDIDLMLGRGDSSQAMMGFDRLRQETVAIKRQRPDTRAALRDTAAYTMLDAFRHPNLLCMYGIWTGEFQGIRYLYIAMELCSTSLWKYIGVGNPEHRPAEFTARHAQIILLGIVRGASRIHSLDVFHGDLSMSNILLKPNLDVKIADLGVVTGHTFFTQDSLCAAYIRPPEAILGSELKCQVQCQGADAWAVAVCALALYTGLVPTWYSTQDEVGNQTADEKLRSRHALVSSVKLLPAITDASWPGHRELPHWQEYESAVRECDSSDGLRNFIAANFKGEAGDNQPRAAASFIECGLRWDPDRRSPMQFMQTELQAMQGCQPTAEIDMPRVANPGQGAKQDPPAAKAPTSAGSVRPLQCQCAGNCGMQPCTRRHNQKRCAAVEVQVCQTIVPEGETLCSECQCELKDCDRPKMRNSRRWCGKHTAQFMTAEFATPDGRGTVPPEATLNLKVVLRVNHLLKH